MKNLSKLIEYLNKTMTFEEVARILAMFSKNECLKYVNQNGAMTPEIAYNLIGYCNNLNPKTIMRKDPKQTILNQKHWDRAVNDNPYNYNGIPRPYRTAALGTLYVINKLNHMGPKAHSNKDEFLKKFRKSQLRALIANTPEAERAKVTQQLVRDNELRKKDINTITYEDCFNAVDMNPLQIQNVPESLIDRNLCIMAAYREGSTAFNYIPARFMSKPMIRHAIKNDETIDYRHIPQKFLTEDIYFLLLKYNRIILSHVPVEERTPLMCILAVYFDEYNREFIPEEILNNEQYKEIFDSMIEVSEETTDEDMV